MTQVDKAAPPTRGPDRATVRTGLVIAGLVVALVAGFAIGRAGVGARAPIDPAPAGGDHTHSPGTGPHDHSGGTVAAGAEVAGLSLSAGGYTLVPAVVAWTAGRQQDFRFHIEGPQKAPVTDFAVVHDRPMHMIVARRDLSGYQHLHPSMASDGTWTVPLTLDRPGIWRVYLDFSVLDAAGGQSAMTLGTDLVVAGDYAPQALPAPAREAQVDGFTVTYEGTPQVGATQPLLFRVFGNGRPVTELEPYLGAYGHLVSIRAGDLGYLHVHPEEELSGGAVKFWIAAPSPGDYRMFLDFQVAGVVRTAEFTVRLD